MSTPSFAVVGAGPAGATAARLLASRGARVSLFEARRLPRHKLCGGGLTPKAQRLVPASVLETVEHRVHLVESRGGWLPPLLLDESAAEIAMVERSTFDLALTRAAADAGVEVREDADHEVFISSTAEHVAGAPPYDPDLVAIPSDDYRGVYSYYGYGYDSLGFSAGYPYVTRDPNVPGG